MGWRDRPYANDDSAGGGFGAGQVRFALPPWTPVVKWLIIANGLAALATIVFTWKPAVLPAWINADGRHPLYAIGGLDLRLTVLHGQLWRLFTYQYLHGSPFHLLFNMIGLYFLGPPLERQFGRRTFFTFYTACGVAAGVLYILADAILQASGAGSLSFLIGASGSVLGLLAGCAILFPQMIIILLFFPVPIRFAALLLVAVYTLAILWGGNLADAAHLGGMIAAWGWIMIGRRYEGRMIRREGGAALSIRRSAGDWEKKQKRLAREAEKVDRILAKVKEQGINSLTRAEKRTLRKATERQKEEDREREQRLREWGAR